MRGHFDEACLELSFDTVPKQTVFNILQIIGRKPITYKNVFPVEKSSLLSEIQVKYMEDIIINETQQTLGYQGRR